MSKATSPRVSVLMPVYNAEPYLAEALGSILAQENCDFECIVVNDGSTDGSAELLEDFAQHDSRVKVISRPNTGIVGALNDGLDQCRGEFIARMDADDVACPQRLTRQCAFLDTHPHCVGVGCWVDYLDPDGEHIWTWQMPDDPTYIQRGLLDGDITGLVHPAMMLRRAAVEAVGGYRRECEYVEDLDLFVRLLDQGEFSIVPESACSATVNTRPASTPHAARSNAPRSRTVFWPKPASAVDCRKSDSPPPRSHALAPCFGGSTSPSSTATCAAPARPRDAFSEPHRTPPPPGAPSLNSPATG